MSLTETLALGLVLLFLLVAAIRLFSAPLKLAVRVLLNAALGFGAMYLLNLTSGFTGLALGLSWFNGLVVGILGVPGFVLLVLVRWVLG
ncbi:MAG: Pro-sigmaK processing inhibitor BofA [Ruminococcaceae bacterium]|jgi:inhibitor of the pro-sigma K processing machinery|nr:Pro-sigmaK processing inhibitor BofA [Oscillospiraceae bacterium]